jgi:dCMP deaminase
MFNRVWGSEMLTNPDALKEIQNMFFETDQTRWDKKHLRHALFIGENYSKDPSTKLGALIVRHNNTIVSMGYNGFARGIKDTEERLNDRSLKYPLTVHGEMNAIISAKENLSGCTLYVAPLPPCSSCTAAIINSGITRVVAAYDKESLNTERSKAMGFDLSQVQFKEARIEFTTYALTEIRTGK